MTVRRASAAGLFYPDDAHDLRNEVDRLVREARLVDGPAPTAMIQPHAGYVYSGPIAATGYRRLRHTRPDVRQVVILGPNHTVPLDRIALSGADEWETPLGPVPVAADLREGALDAAFADVDDHPHITEHAIEVQLPFLQRLLDPGWELLPVVVGDCTPEAAADLVDRCAADNTLIIVSTDLSHYHSYVEARRIDEVTVDEIVARTIMALGPRRACGFSPLRGLLAARSTRDLTLEVLDVRNSGDTSGERHRVVGYASMVLC